MKLPNEIKPKCPVCGGYHEVLLDSILGKLIACNKIPEEMIIVIGSYGSAMAIKILVGGYAKN